MTPGDDLADCLAGMNLDKRERVKARVAAEEARGAAAEMMASDLVEELRGMSLQKRAWEDRVREVKRQGTVEAERAEAARRELAQCRALTASDAVDCARMARELEYYYSRECWDPAPEASARACMLAFSGVYSAMSAVDIPLRDGTRARFSNDGIRRACFGLLDGVYTMFRNAHTHGDAAAADIEDAELWASCVRECSKLLSSMKCLVDPHTPTSKCALHGDAPCFPQNTPPAWVPRWVDLCRWFWGSGRPFLEEAKDAEGRTVLVDYSAVSPFDSRRYERFGRHSERLVEGAPCHILFPAVYLQGKCVKGTAIDGART